VKREVSWMPHAPVGAKKGIKKRLNYEEEKCWKNIFIYFYIKIPNM
jgi:hypothetical protein